MLKRMLMVIVIVACFIPLGHIMLFFLSIAAGNIASPNQYIVVTPTAAWQKYWQTLPTIINNSYVFPGLDVGIWDGIQERAWRSIGLLSVAASIAVVAGIKLGMRVSQNLNTQLPHWFIVLASTGNTLQSLFVASSSVAIMYFVMVYTPYNPPVPINGFGWNLHMVLPVIALALRPIMSIAHDTATLVGQASQQPHIIATQARGFSNHHIVQAHIWPAQQSTIGLICVANIRQMIAELMIVELVFGWGGLGESIVRSIVPPTFTNVPAVAIYLDATTFATMGVVIMLLFAALELLRIMLLPRHAWMPTQENPA